MSFSCKSCDSPVNGIEKIACRGHCGSIFHRTCIPGMQRSALDLLSSFNNNLYWLCDDCARCFNEWVQQSVSAAPIVNTKKLCEAVDNLNTVVSNLSSRIENHFPANYGSVTQRGLFVKRLPEDPPTPKRRRENNAKIRATAAAVCGTRAIQREIRTVADEREQFWVYLSRLDPSHTVEEIVAMTQECLGTSDAPKAVLLVKKDTDLTKLNFVSFRVELPSELKDTALKASTWPTGVLVREFNFDQPKQDRFR
ncbi:uncharacterized protein LOC131695119 [Topomyia yanbarensis]|uniref:uncharacterized protein LOC131680373 n=1 Tax=Topomyia yanbarensis TaxID=2498891 RepID=UPI00273AF183|nr:uncharacterized protein LOC131680373 [Topomyia yanbarensis]XP_058839621.1 uncharacterized protein LOC131695119 [Topomyia yanbarensis]